MTKKYLKGLVQTIKGSNAFNVIASTGAVDRQGESIDPKGWDLENYRKNPVMLWAHNYEELPVGVADSMEINDEGLVISGRFADPKANPKAEQIRLLYEDNILQAVSVGFIPKERNGSLITKAELLEVSFVPVPANPQALALAMTKGFDPKLIKEMETGDQTDTEKQEVITKPAICEPDSPSFNPEACGAIFCNPESPSYNEEYCELMREGVKAGKQGTKVQTLILSKEVFTTFEAAQQWVKDHDFEYGNYDETDNSWRFRQFEPEACVAGSFATIELTTGVQAAICVPATEEEADKTIQVLEVKSGRVLSQKNRDLISTAVTTFKQSITILQELLEATEPAPKAGGKIETGGGQLNQRSASSAGDVEIPLETLKELQSHTRQADKHNELASTILKRVLKR